MVHLCKMIISQGIFSFFQNFDSLGCLGGGRVAVGGAKNGKNSKWEKNLCRIPYLRNHTSYDFYLWSLIHSLVESLQKLFMVLICKIISPGIFFFFLKFWFFGLLGGYKGKKWQKWQNGPKWQRTLYFAIYISGTMRHMILIYGAHV